MILIFFHFPLIGVVNISWYKKKERKKLLLQSTFILSNHKEYVVVGRSSFLPFPGEELKQTPLTLKLIDCICNWWVDQAQYCYSKSIERAREKFIKLIKIWKYWSQKRFSAGCRNIVCKPHVWDSWSTATKKLSNKTEQVVLFVTFDFFLWCYFDNKRKCP